MRGERTLDGKPFRYGGFFHDYSKTTLDWYREAEEIGVKFENPYRKCYCCGNSMISGVFDHIQKTYPYCGVYKIPHGKNKGMKHFKIICRGCAYRYGRGVIEKDGNTYMGRYDFKEE